MGGGGGSEKAKQSSLLSTWNLGLTFAGHRPPPNTLVHSPRDLGPLRVAPVFPSNLSPQGKSRTAPLRAAPLTFASFTRRRGAPSSDLPFLPPARRPPSRPDTARRPRDSPRVSWGPRRASSSPRRPGCGGSGRRALRPAGVPARARGGFPSSGKVSGSPEKLQPELEEEKEEEGEGEGKGRGGGRWGRGGRGRRKRKGRARPPPEFFTRTS